MNQLLRVYIAVVEKQNFTRAAEALYMTQPAVTQYIHTFEKKLGTKLLERSNKHVQLNKAGEIAYKHAKEILGLHSQMQTLIDDLMNKASGNLAIGASYTFGEYILPHLVATLQSRYPLIKPKITIANTRRISEWVANRQLDIGIVDGDVNNQNLTMESFAENLMYIVVSTKHPLASATNLTVQDLINETWIVREATSGTRAATEKMFSQLNFYPQSIMEFGSTQIIKESVEAGLGITFLSQCTVQKEISFGIFKILTVAGTPLRNDFSFITQKTEFRTKTTEVMIDMLQNNKMLQQFLEGLYTVTSLPK